MMVYDFCEGEGRVKELTLKEHLQGTSTVLGASLAWDHCILLAAGWGEGCYS